MSYSRITDLFPDKLYLSLLFHHRMGYWMDWKNPKTFNEKLQWLKLYNRKPEYTIMADKVKAKEWVADRIGSEYIIPTLGVWDDPDEIDFDKLPNQFVLKCNHNSGLGMYICKDKSNMDVEAVKHGLREGLKENYYLHGREWPYKDVPRKILAEQFMVDESGTELKDYKVFNFDGEPEIIEVDYDRFVNHGRNFYDKDWNFIEMEIQYPSNRAHQIARPEHLQEMLESSRKLSQKLPHLRTDFYSIEGRLYFGEMTFFHEAGMGLFRPNEWDERLGKLIKLPMGGGVMIDSQYYIILIRCIPISSELADYKFFCFDGEPYYCQVIRNRSTEETIDIYDMEWNHQPFVGLNPEVKNGSVPVPCPPHLNKMKEICRCLAKDIPFVRVDLYVINEREYFGELTFFPMQGMGRFTPGEWNEKIGDLIHLPDDSLIHRGGVNCKWSDNGLIIQHELSDEFNKGGLTDYKFTCFNGVVDNVMVCIDRATGEPKFYFFDKEWNLLPLNKRGLETSKDFQLPRPPVLDKMFEIAAKLSQGLPYLRVDLYYINNKIYFGETTFFPQSGFDANLLPDTDRAFGERIDLSIVEH